MKLPICCECKVNEVKPGEDSCWDCLGEKQEPYDVYQTVTIDNPPSWRPMIKLGKNGTITIGDFDVEKEIRVLQERIELINKKLESSETIWKKIKKLLA